MVTDDIEAVARKLTERRVRRIPGLTEEAIRAWVDAHWPATAAELQAGLMDADGNVLPGWTVARYVEAVCSWKR